MILKERACVGESLTLTLLMGTQTNHPTWKSFDKINCSYTISFVTELFNNNQGRGNSIEKYGC